MPLMADRVKERTSTTGTGNYALGGGVVGFQTFASAFSLGDTIYYCCENGTDWEVGEGELISTATGWELSRDTIHASSNGGSEVSWAVGNKSIFCTHPAVAITTTTAAASNASTTATAALNTANIAATDVTNLTSDLSNSSDTSKGAALLGYKGRTQYSRNQDRPHIFDYIPAGQHANIIAGVSTYDATSDFQSAITEADTGSVIWLPQRGIINVTSVDINKGAITIAGENGSAGAYSSKIIGTQDGVPVFNVTRPQFCLRGVNLTGLSNTTEKGNDTSQDAVKLTAPSDSNNLDAVFIDCVFVYFRDCVNMQGRNARFLNTLFSNSRRAVSIPDMGLTDVRGLELYSCRYHSMGKTGVSDSACVWVDSAADFQDVIAIGGYADDCVTFFNGFSSGLKIILPITRSRGSGVLVDSTGHSISYERRLTDIRIAYSQFNASTVAASALQVLGSAIVQANVISVNSGGYGIYIEPSYAKISGRIESAGQAANNTYDAVHVTGTHIHLDDLLIGQSVGSSPANKARYGLNDQGADTQIGNVEIVGAYATAAFNKDSTKYAGGTPPNRPARVSISWASAMPTSGTYQIGSIVWHTAPAIAGTAGSRYVINGWRRLTSGSGHVLNTDWAEMRTLTGT